MRVQEQGQGHQDGQHRGQPARRSHWPLSDAHHLHPCCWWAWLLLLELQVRDLGVFLQEHCQGLVTWGSHVTHFSTFLCYFLCHNLSDIFTSLTDVIFFDRFFSTISSLCLLSHSFRYLVPLFWLLARLAAAA